MPKNIPSPFADRYMATGIVFMERAPRSGQASPRMLTIAFKAHTVRERPCRAMPAPEPDPRKACRFHDKASKKLQEEGMEWQGYTTAGWAQLLCAVAALEKQYGVSIP